MNSNINNGWTKLVKGSPLAILLDTKILILAEREKMREENTSDEEMFNEFLKNINEEIRMVAQ